MNTRFMMEAINLAKKAFKKNEVPVGAIIVRENKIIAKAYNKVEKTKTSINHAEMIAIKKASKKLKNWRLIDCDMYVTLEPCDMCYHAIYLSRIKNVYYCLSKKNVETKLNLYQLTSFENEYKKMLQAFFKNKR